MGEYRLLNHDKLKNRKRSTISTEQALKNVSPINWSERVLSGKRKITIL